MDQSSKNEILPKPESFPLILRHAQEVKGSNFTAIIKLIAPVLLSKESDGWQFSGVQPAIFITCGESREDVMLRGREDVTRLFADLAKGESQESFFELMDSIANEVDFEESARWHAALSAIRMHKADGTEIPDDISKLELVHITNESPFRMEVELVTHGLSFASEGEPAKPSLPMPELTAANNELKKAA